MQGGLSPVGGLAPAPWASDLHQAARPGLEELGGRAPKVTSGDLAVPPYRPSWVTCTEEQGRPSSFVPEPPSRAQLTGWSGACGIRHPVQVGVCALSPARSLLAAGLCWVSRRDNGGHRGRHGGGQPEEI